MKFEGRSPCFKAALKTNDGAVVSGDLKERTKQFARRIIALCRNLPGTTEGYVIGKQLLRSGTSVAANYRGAGRARSRLEFAAKLGIVVEEVDETLFSFECIADNAILPPKKLGELIKEANERTAIFTTARKTAKDQGRF